LKKRNAYTVYLTYQGGFSFIFSMIVTVNMVYQVSSVGLNPLQLVLVGTALELSAALFEVPTGIVADVYGRRLSVIIGTALTGLGFMIEASLPVWGIVLLAQVVWGFGWTFISGALDAWLADELGPERAGPAYLRGAQVGQVTGLAAILPGVVLGSIALNLPILLGGALFVVLAGFLMLFMPEDGFQPVPAAERSSWRQMRDTLRDGIGLVRVRPILLALLLIELCYGAYSEGFDRLWTAFFLQDITLPQVGDIAPVVWIGGIKAVTSLLAIGATEIVRRRLDLSRSGSASRAITVLYGLVMVGTVGLGLAGHLTLALIAYWVAATARATAGPVFTAWLNQHIDSEVRATVLSMAAQANEIGQIAGGPGIGVVGTAFSLRAALVGSGLLLLPALGLLRRQSRPEAAAAPVDVS
jgi:DHA3 family tetracycline resistance protein-like MFS transporter